MQNFPLCKVSKNAIKLGQRLHMSWKYLLERNTPSVYKGIGGCIRTRQWNTVFHSFVESLV